MGRIKTPQYRPMWVKDPNAWFKMSETSLCGAKRKGCAIYAHLLWQHDCVKILFQGYKTKTKRHTSWSDVAQGKLVDVLKSATITNNVYGEVLNLHMDFHGEAIVYSIPEWRELYCIEDNNRNLMCKDKYYPEIKRFVTDLGMLKGAIK